MLRFVDVVLILLFGFIAISEVSQQSQITLPQSVETPPSYPDKEQVIFIGITPNGRYLVDNETRVITDIADLRAYILDQKQHYERMQARIRIRYRANYNTPVRYTIQAASLCDQLGVVKGIDVRLKSKL